MKSPLLMAVFLTAFCCRLTAQHNFRFADSTAQWNELYSSYAFGFLQSAKTIVYTVQKDTTIDSISYQKITSADTTRNYFLRQDSTKSVFIRRYNDSIDYKIYDFGKNAGDTFHIKHPEYYGNDILIKIDSTDSVMLGGKWRNRFYVSPPEWSNDVWIEGIGSVSTGLWAPLAEWNIADGDGVELLCYFENNQLLFHNERWEDTCVFNKVVSINEIAESDFKIYPNPVTRNHITIESESLHDNATFQLFDLTGRLLLQQQLTEKTTHVILDGISKGMYQYTVTSNQRIVGLSKLIVQ